MGELLFITISTILALFIGFIAIRRKINLERSLGMVFLRVIIARKDSDLDEKKETVKDFREQISIMEQLLASLKYLYASNIKGWIYGQEYISLEYVAHNDEIYFYLVVPRHSRILVEKQIVGFYPDAFVEETEEVNIFENRKVIRGEMMKLKKSYEFPIRTYQKLETDSINAILSALSKLDSDESSVIQFLMRPVDDDWQEKIRKKIKKSEKGSKHYFSWNPLDWIFAFTDIFFQNQNDEKSPKPEEENEAEPIDDEGLMKEKIKKTGYAMSIRIITTGNDVEDVEGQLSNIISSFSQFASPAYNKFKPIKRKSLSLLIRHYIYRRFAWWQRSSVMNSEEIATLFHFPHSKYNKQPEIRWQRFKVLKAPINIAKEGLYIGENIYRGERKPIYVKNEDRFRHFYVIGQTGTGKSSILSVMARQDIRNNRGMAVMDPHGDFAK